MKNTNIGFDRIRLHLVTNRTRDVLAKEVYKTGTTTETDNGITWRTKKLRNLEIKLYKNSLIIAGSFSTYRYGDNLVLLSAEEVLEIADEISECLGIQLRWATIRALEFGVTGEMNESPKWYYDYWLPSNRYRIDRSQEDSVYIQTIPDKKSLVIYDKSIESNTTGSLMRIEMRLKNSEAGTLTGDISRSSLFLEDLLRISTLKCIVDTFKGMTDRFLLRPLAQSDFTDISNVENLKDYALAELLRNDQIRENLAKLIEVKSQAKAIPPTTASRLRAIAKQIPDSVHNERIEETRRLINETCEKFLTISPMTDQIVYIPDSSSQRIMQSPESFCMGFIETMNHGGPSAASWFLNNELRDDQLWLLDWHHKITSIPSLGLDNIESSPNGRTIVTFSGHQLTKSDRTIPVEISLVLFHADDRYYIESALCQKYKLPKSAVQGWIEPEELTVDEKQLVDDLSNIVSEVCKAHQARESYSVFIAEGCTKFVRPTGESCLGSLQEVLLTQAEVHLRFRLDTSLPREQFEVSFIKTDSGYRILRMNVLSFWKEDLPKVLRDMFRGTSPQ